MKRVVFIILILLLSFSSSTYAEIDLTAFVRQYEPSIAIVRTYDQTGRSVGTGSGFFITSDGQFVTNRHVLENAYSAVIEMPSGEKFTIEEIIGKSPELDLVKCQISGTNIKVPYLNVASSIPEKGTRIVVFGNPQGMKFSVSEGIVSGIQEFPDRDSPNIKLKGTFIQFTAPVSPGSSGGPVLNEMGEVVGITAWKLNPKAIIAENINFAIPATMISTLTNFSEKPILSEDNALSGEKPLVGTLTFFSKNLLAKLKDPNDINTLISDKVTSKFIPAKFSVYDSEYLNPLFTTYYLNQTGLKAMPEGCDIEKQYVNSFAISNGYRYIVLFYLDMTNNRYQDGLETRADVDLIIDVRILDTSYGDYIFDKPFECQGSSNGGFFKDASSNKAIISATKRGLNLFSREFSISQFEK